MRAFDHSDKKRKQEEESLVVGPKQDSIVMLNDLRKESRHVHELLNGGNSYSLVQQSLQARP